MFGPQTYLQVSMYTSGVFKKNWTSVGTTVGIDLMGIAESVVEYRSVCGRDSRVLVGIVDGGRRSKTDTTDVPSTDKNPESPVVKRYVAESTIPGPGVSPHMGGAGVVIILPMGVVVVVVVVVGMVVVVVVVLPLMRHVPLSSGRMATCLIVLVSASVKTIYLESNDPEMPQIADPLAIAAFPVTRAREPSPNKVEVLLLTRSKSRIAPLSESDTARNCVPTILRRKKCQCPFQVVIRIKSGACT